MPTCLPSRYRFLDLIFALVGTVTFLLDLGSDVWGAVEYYRAGDLAWAALLLAFYGCSSVALQLLSWGWFWADRRLFIKPGDAVSEPQEKETPVSPTNEKNGKLFAEGAALTHGHVKEVSAEAGRCSSSLAGHGGGNGHIDRGQEKVVEVSTGFPQSVARMLEEAVPTQKPTGKHAVPSRGDDTASTPDYPDAVACKADTEHEPGDAGTALLGRGQPLQAPNSNTSHPEDKSVRGFHYTPPQTAKETESKMCPQLSYSEDCFLRRFNTALPLFCPQLLAILHFLQLGYPYRCIHSLEVGVTAYMNKDQDSKPYQEYAYLLTHDISMMRLIETFMENTPQLILLLYILVQRGVIHTFQYFGICTAFISISWSLLDYHQSLRFFLRDKQKLSISSSLVYFLWNFLIIVSRIGCIMLFTSAFHCWIALHFFLLWGSFFFWAWLQDTNFMENGTFEHFYRAIVAVILYFSWFNIADGRTLYRCMIYYIFLMIDSIILLLSWNYLRIPSVLDAYEKYVNLVVVLTFFAGHLVRLLYYKFMHPNVGHKPEKFRDEHDGITQLSAANQRILHTWNA